MSNLSTGKTWTKENKISENVCRTVDKKLLTRNSSVCLDDRELDQLHNEGDVSCGDNMLVNFNPKATSSNFPDVVNDINTTSHSQNFVGDCKDPDIVRSSSSSSEDKSLDVHGHSDRAGCRPECPKILASSVSSFSSSSSKQSTISYLGPASKPETSAVSSCSSLDDDDGVQQHDVLCRGADHTTCIVHQDSVFAQESEDVFDQPQPQQARKYEPSSNIDSPLVESHSLQSSRNSSSNEILNSFERVQRARNRFSSSGYGTGSGGSTQGNSTYKTSVQLSQESIIEDDGVRSQDTQTQTLNHEEPNFLENDVLPRDTRFSLMTVRGVVSPGVENQAVVKLQCNNYGSSNITPENSALVCRGVDADHDPSHLSCDVTCGSSPASADKQQHVPGKSGSLQVQQQFHTTAQNIPGNSSSLIQKQFHATTQNVPGNSSSLQVDKQIQTAAQSIKHFHTPAQNIKQTRMNVDSTIVQTLPHIGLSGIIPTSLQQHSLASNERSTAYTDSPHHMFAPSLQHHPTISGGPHFNPFQTSSSSSGSCFVPSSVEDRWLTEPSHMSLAKQFLLQSGPGVSESSGESRYHLDSLIRCDHEVIQCEAVSEGAAHNLHAITAEQSEGAAQDLHAITPQLIPDFDELISDSLVLSDLSSAMFSLEGQPDRRLWEMLERSARCTDNECSVAECVQMKQVLAALQDERSHVRTLCEAEKALLLTMFNHSVHLCDHPKCPFPWCADSIDHQDELSQEGRFLIMKRRVENFAEHFLLLSSPQKYIKLKPTLPYDSFPLEGQDWVRLCMLGNSRKTLLVQPTKSEKSGLYSDIKYWVIKKVSTADDGDHWGVYSRLREVNHKSVASLLWAASCGDHMLVCSLFEDFSLQEILPSMPPQELRFVPIFSVLQQLMSALTHLKSLGIAYLYWASKNLLVRYNSSVDFVVKLSNFSCSVLLEPPDGKQPCFDGGHLLLALPRHIITPELRDYNKVEFASDIWGLGCLLHELVTGCPVWHEHRHDLDSEFKPLIGKKPDVPTGSPELVDVFTACWEIDSKNRVQLSDLEIMLIDAYHVHLTSS